jgi:hypothetical protein
MMAYASWSVVFGEQPSAAKWNILGTNDASFNDGTGIANMALSVTALSNPYKFSVYRAAAANTGAAAFAQIVFDTEDFDTNNNFAAGTYTIGNAGFYGFAARTSFTSTRGILSMYKNGAEAKRGDDSTVASSAIGLSVAVEAIQLALSDTIDFRAFGATAVALDVGATQTYANGMFKSKT